MKDKFAPPYAKKACAKYSYSSCYSYTQTQYGNKGYIRTLLRFNQEDKDRVKL